MNLTPITPIRTALVILSTPFMAVGILLIAGYLFARDLATD